MIKVDSGQEIYHLNAAQLEAIALLAPGATITEIKEGDITNKYRYVAGNYSTEHIKCGNDACVSNVYDYVEPFHWLNNGSIICNYCEQPDDLITVFSEKRFKH